MAPQSSSGLEPRWQMVACLQDLDSYRASNTANTDNWGKEGADKDADIYCFFSSACFNSHGVDLIQLHVSIFSNQYIPGCCSIFKMRDLSLAFLFLHFEHGSFYKFIYFAEHYAEHSVFSCSSVSSELLYQRQCYI